METEGVTPEPLAPSDEKPINSDQTGFDAPVCFVLRDRFPKEFGISSDSSPMAPSESVDQQAGPLGQEPAQGRGRVPGQVSGKESHPR
jgi:hypothetical protein